MDKNFLKTCVHVILSDLIISLKTMGASELDKRVLMLRMYISK